MDKAKRKPYQMLLILILLFAIPIYLAIWLYKNDFSLTGKTINHGVLISPPIAAAELHIPASHKWSLILFAPNNCQASCQKKLFKMLQIQKACGKNKNRVQRMLITYHTKQKIFDTAKQRYPHLQIIGVTKKSLSTIIKQHPTLGFTKQPNTIFMADPNGNIMMAYKPTTNPMNIFKDLKHVLRLSQIG